MGHSSLCCVVCGLLYWTFISYTVSMKLMVTIFFASCLGKRDVAQSLRFTGVKTAFMLYILTCPYSGMLDRSYCMGLLGQSHRSYLSQWAWGEIKGPMVSNVRTWLLHLMLFILMFWRLWLRGSCCGSRVSSEWLLVMSALESTVKFVS